MARMVRAKSLLPSYCEKSIFPARGSYGGPFLIPQKNGAFNDLLVLMALDNIRQRHSGAKYAAFLSESTGEQPLIGTR